MKKVYDKFEFTSNTIDYYTIESEVTNYYHLGMPYNSNFMELDLGIHNDYVIQANNGLIYFTAIVGQSKEGKYIITVVPNSISKYE